MGETPAKEAAMEGSENRAKEPVSALLAGPYGHPFHPILVTVPIGAWLSSLVFDLASHLSDPATSFATGARWLIGIGVLGALAAATVGFLDFLTIPSGTPAHRTAVTHMVLNLAVTAAFAANFAWRLGSDETATAIGPLALSAVSLAGLGLSGALGGKLAYHYGVRVADDDTQATGFTTAPASDAADRTTVRPPSTKGH
jgi:uncharacterized membrane protein